MEFCAHGKVLHAWEIIDIIALHNIESNKNHQSLDNKNHIRADYIMLSSGGSGRLI